MSTMFHVLVATNKNFTDNVELLRRTNMETMHSNIGLSQALDWPRSRKREQQCGKTSLGLPPTRKEERWTAKEQLEAVGRPLPLGTKYFIGSLNNR